MRAIYLSGAPRLSTKAETESLGPRSHILGVMNAFRNLGIELDEFIVGDSAPTSLHAQGSEKRLSANRFSILAADALRLAYRVRSRRKLSKAIKGVTYDFAYERYALYQELGSVLKRAGATWILEVNALLALESTSDRRATSSRRFAMRAERKTLDAADTILAVTQALADEITAIYSIDSSKIIVIQNGVDHTRYAPLTSGIEPVSRPRVGFVGTLYSWQNVDGLIDSLAKPEFANITLDIAGDGPERQNLEAQVLAAGIGDRVMFHGRMHPDSVPDFLESVDLCFAGHASENGSYFSPLKLWEYLAAGKPVLASAHEATTKLSEEGFAVICFGESTGYPSLESALRSSIRDLDALKISAATRQSQVWNDYSWTTRIAPVLEAVGAS